MTQSSCSITQIRNFFFCWLFHRYHLLVEMYFFRVATTCWSKLFINICHLQWLGQKNRKNWNSGSLLSLVSWELLQFCGNSSSQVVSLLGYFAPVLDMLLHHQNVCFSKQVLSQKHLASLEWNQACDHPCSYSLVSRTQRASERIMRLQKILKLGPWWLIHSVVQSLAIVGGQSLWSSVYRTKI